MCGNAYRTQQSRNCPMLIVESSSTDQDAVRVLLGDLGDGRIPGLPAWGSDGDGEADGFQGRTLALRLR